MASRFKPVSLTHYPQLPIRSGSALMARHARTNRADTPAENHPGRMRSSGVPIARI